MLKKKKKRSLSCFLCSVLWHLYYNAQVLRLSYTSRGEERLNVYYLFWQFPSLLQSSESSHSSPDWLVEKKKKRTTKLEKAGGGVEGVGGGGLAVVTKSVREWLTRGKEREREIREEKSMRRWGWQGDLGGLPVKHCSMGRQGLFVLDGGSRKYKERSQLMIIDITTGFFPCTGCKLGRPWPCLADSRAEACAYVSSTWPCEGHSGAVSTAASRGTNSSGGGLPMRAPTARATWGFPVTEPVLQEWLQYIHTQLLRHQKTLIACSEC